ncbi:MAG: hypothetical protein QXE51_02700 [Nitrososphaeria archaeon]
MIKMAEFSLLDYLIPPSLKALIVKEYKEFDQKITNLRIENQQLLDKLEEIEQEIKKIRDDINVKNDGK